MSTILQNAPVIELIAEARWHLMPYPSAGINSPGSVISMIPNQGACETFFMRFAGLAGKLGFQLQERLVPHGFPLITGEPVLRFKSENEPGVLYQIGPDLFTVNATTPYKTWDNFLPHIKNGFDALLEAREEAEKDIPFYSVGLRYIDAFSEPLLRGMNTVTFLEETLGIAITLPNGIKRLIVQDKSYKPVIQLQIPMENDAMMQIGIGEGMVKNAVAIVMDTAVLTTNPVIPNTNHVMDSLNNAHKIIHDMFFEITQPISDLMSRTKES